MVGIVVVSHSEALAEGAIALAREMAGPEVALEPAGGIGEPGVLGTDAERVRSAIERAASPDGVLVLMDLGSAVLSAELALQLLAERVGPVRLSQAPLVEGTVAAALAARGNASLAQVEAEARAALGLKAAQLEGDRDEPAAASQGPQPEREEGGRPQLHEELQVRNRIGLHARPAARVVSLAQRFDAELWIGKKGSGGLAPARSLSALLTLGARFGDTLTVTAGGRQAREALDALRELAAAGFGEGTADPTRLVGSAPSTPSPTPAAPSPAPAREAPSPRPPAIPPQTEVPPPPPAGAQLRGLPASFGIAIGPARHLRPQAFPPERPPTEPAAEHSLLARGLAAARVGIEHDRELVEARAGAEQAAIFDAHLALLEDEELLAPARLAIDGGTSAEQALTDAAIALARRYRELPERLLRERATDVLDVGRRVAWAIAAAAGVAGPAAPADTTGAIVIADELAPADAAALDPERTLGVATARGSPTAHAAILARSLALPAVVGLGPELLAVPAGTILLLDGEAGVVTVDPPPELLERAQRARRRRARRLAGALAHAREPALLGGRRIAILANIGNPAEVESALALGAEGVGLLRTEFLYLERPTLPSEEEQVETLRRIAVALDGRPLIVRTLDVGADKPLAALLMEEEANPFLGVRGIRLALRHPELLCSQLRAILRVAADHPVKAMLPMVTSAGELLAVRKLLADARSQLRTDAPLELGIMVEVPAAALAAERLARHADFFSLGTNDLAQYTMAADRGDRRLAALLAGPQPPLLRLVQATLDGAGACSRPVGVCGELAADPASAVLLAGLGVCELSMTPTAIPEVKAALRAVDPERAHAAALEALASDDAEKARALALALL